jgi:hypothetical protein
MAQELPLPIRASFFEPVDKWLNDQAPSVDLAIAQLENVRRLARQATLAEAHIVTYVRDQLNVDDLSDDPEILNPELSQADF